MDRVAISIEYFDTESRVRRCEPGLSPLGHRPSLVRSPCVAVVVDMSPTRVGTLRRQESDPEALDFLNPFLNLPNQWHESRFPPSIPPEAGWRSCSQTVCHHHGGRVRGQTHQQS